MRIRLWVFVLIVMPLDAYAYIGPGAALSAIGSFFALVAAFVLALVGFIWMPIRRRWKKRKQLRKDLEEPPPTAGSDE
jgi:uncharacterized membrane protein YdjX (TVP38/TMEM64 family)